MGRIKETRKLYNEVINEISESAENWLDFLNSSSWNFKYDFDDQILIFAQRPDARACASMEEWNKKLRRWVNAGTKPIYVFDKNPYSEYPFRLVFDLSDTHNYNNTEYKLWYIKKEYENDIIESLEVNFGDIDEKKSLAQAIRLTSYNMVLDNIEDYLTAIENHKLNSKLENVSNEEIRSIFITTAWASVSYMMMTRCGINAKEQINIEDFEFIKYFNTQEVLTVFGSSVSDIAEMGLRQIARTVTSLQKIENLKNRTFEKNEKNDYSKDNEKIKGGLENDRENRVHETRRLLYAESNNEEREDTSRKIRSNEIQLSKDKQELRIDDFNNEQEIDRTLEGNTRTGIKESANDNRTNEETRWNNRRIESKRSDEVGRNDEQLQNDSRGNSSERNNLHLEEKSQRRILTQEEMKLDKDFLQDEYIGMLLSNVENLKVTRNEIKEFYRTHLSLDERTEYIKQAFSDAYTEIEVDNVRLGYKTYENVLHLWKGNYLNRTAEVYYNWNIVAEYIEGLIMVNEFNDLYKRVPSYDEQMQILQVEANNAPTFSFTQEIIDYALQLGSNMEESKMRIYSQFEQDLSRDENIKFLKQEYGWGASSSIHIGTRIGISYDGKGIKLYRGYDENAPQILMSWNKVEKRISELIKLDRYLNPLEKEEYSNWLKKEETEKQLQESKKQLVEENKDKSFEERLLSFYKEYDIFNAEYSDNEEQDLKQIQEQLKDIQYIEDTINYLKEVKKSEDTNTELVEQIDYFTEELTKINEENKEQNIAERINEFIKDYYLYDYIDNSSFYRSRDDNIAVIKADINDSLNVKDYINALKKIIENGKLDNEKLLEAKDLVSILEQRLPKYEYHLGDTVYIGADEYEVAGIKDNIVTLYDPKFPLFNKQMEYEEFDKKVQENYSNDHLKVENRKDAEKGVKLLNTETKEKLSETNEQLSAQKEDNENKLIQNVNESSKNEGIKPNFTKKKSKIQDYILYPDTPIEKRSNYKILDNSLGIGTDREKYVRNIEAIKVLKKCEKEGRYATSEEQEVLSKYVGWGGLEQVFDEKNNSWSNEYSELKELLTDEEYKQARASTLTSFYTPPIVIRTIYEILENMGLKEANILEPSCGVGNFLGMLPDDLANCKMYGVELDIISGKIAQQLYQKSTIAVTGYEKVNLPDSFFDVAVGNVPFGNFKINDKKYDKNNFLIHDYFFAKTLDKVRPRGVIAFITSKGTMDKKSPDVRKYIAQRAELLGAIRLPDNTFTKNAGTKVTSDILFLQKRENMTDIMPDWVYLDTNKDGIEMNKYFVDNPDMILGEMQMETTQFGEKSTCKAYEGIELEMLLNEAKEKIVGEITEYEVGDIEEREENILPADPNVKNFSYCIIDGKIYFRENSIMVEQELPVTTINRIKGMIELRNCVNDLINLQTEEYPDENIKNAQIKLNRIYDDFVKKYGIINSRGNRLAFEADSSYYLLCSLEVLDEDGKFLRKADMFNKRTIKAYKKITSVDTANEALIVSLSEKAKVDLEYMEKLTNKKQEEIAKELEGIIFKVPMESNKYVTADEYLSGNVREKLKLAEALVETQPEFKVNVEALKKIIPKDIPASEIGIKLGATWIPTEVIEDFMYELLDTSYYDKEKIKVNFNSYNSEWYITNKKYDYTNVKANKTYGTNRINAYEIIEKTLNLKEVKIYDTEIDTNGNQIRVFNAKSTAVAQAKQEQIKQEFENWVFKDQDRREKLVRLYNDKFNSIRPREYSGSHLIFPGMNPEIQLRKHQKNAIAHILYGRNVLLAHEVGAGKTFEMVAAAMESKRLGLCNKSIFVVPNHIIEQFASEFLQLYPSANILVATKKDFATANRKKFCSRIATGDFDAVIIGHSQFEKIPMSIERQQQLLEKQISDIIDSIDEAKRNKAENFTIKQMEKTRRNLLNKLEKLNNQERKDNVINFEQLGIDKMFVDEAHNYKNLFLYTKMHNVGGIGQTDAQKSSDLFMKCQYLDEITGGKGTVFATGTPVSNSMVELYTMQRYLQYSDLVKMGLANFDDWASIFGETVTAMELSPEGTGYRSKTRFSKFHNLPELMSLFKEVADIQTADTLNLPTPEVINHNVLVQPSEIQKDMVAKLGERAEAIRKREVRPDVDNMLKITNEGRKLALDQRLMNEMLEDNENGKVGTCANNIYDIWEKTKENKLTQLVFCDLSTPKQFEEKYDEEGNYIFTDVYNDLRRKLVLKGIPREEIAFIHEANNETKKKELFAKVRKGEIRVLIGSTSKMGAGTNVQDKIIALHHLDTPYRPADLTQRNGRGVRQGNQNPKVHIFTYVTEKTFDAYLFQMLERKQSFISQIMTSKTPVRTADDIDEKALSYGEIKALATGNKYILEKTELDSEVAKLKIIKQSYQSQIYDLEDKIAITYPTQIKELEERINAYENDIKQLENNTILNKDGFSKMIIKGIEYSEKEQAGKAILEVCKTKTNPELEIIGEYRGFKLELGFDAIEKKFTMTMKNKYSYSIFLGDDVYGNITRINNALDGIKDKIPDIKLRVEDLKKQLENAKIEVKKPFPQEEELKEKMKKLEELNILLKLDEKDEQTLDIELDEDEKESQMCNKDKIR